LKTEKNKEYLKSNLNLLVILPLFLYKSKKFLLEPRIWAEEGSVYLKSALEDTPLKFSKFSQLFADDLQFRPSGADTFSIN